MFYPLLFTLITANALLAGTIKGAEPERARLLELSLVLDDAVGAERFFVVYGTGDVEALRTRAEAAARVLATNRGDLKADARLPLNERETEQSSVHILKVAR